MIKGIASHQTDYKSVTCEGEQTIEFRMIKDPADIQPLIHLANESHLESRFGYIPFCEKKVRSIIVGALHDRKRHGILMALRRKQVVGAL